MFYRIESFGFTWLLRNSFLLFYLFSTVMLFCLFALYASSYFMENAITYVGWMTPCMERKRVNRILTNISGSKINIQPGDRISFRLSTTLRIESKFLHLSSSSFSYFKIFSIVTNNNAILYYLSFFFHFQVKLF